MNNLKLLIGFLLGAFVFIGGVASAANLFKGTAEPAGYRVENHFTATTTSASTTPPVRINGAKSVTMHFQRGTDGTANAGDTTFSVLVSVDGTNYIQYNKLIDNVTNTNVQNLTRVGAVSMTGTSTKTYSMDLTGESFLTMKCMASEGTDGAHTCKSITVW